MKMLEIIVSDQESKIELKTLHEWNEQEDFWHQENGMALEQVVGQSGTYKWIDRGSCNEVCPFLLFKFY